MRFFRDSCVTPVLVRQPGRFFMYFIYTADLGSGFLLRSTFGAPNRCIHAVVGAGLPCSSEKITIFRSSFDYRFFSFPPKQLQLELSNV
jgi:hypothetical protein